MQKRRERIEKWRAEKKKRELELAKEAAEKGTLAASVPKASVKAWSLEDDEEEEDETKEGENKEQEVGSVFIISIKLLFIYLKVFIH